MADYSLTTRTNPLVNGIGGGTTYDKITQASIQDVLSLDKLARCDRFQLLWSTSKRYDSSFGDLDPQRALQVDYTRYTSHFNLVGQFYYTVPELLPGSAGKTTGGGSTVADRGGLVVAAALNTAGVYVTAEKVTIAGSHGQSSTYSGTLTNAAISDTSGNLVYKVDELLFPSGTTEGDVLEIIVWATAATSSNGYIPYIGIHAPAATAAA